MTHFENQDHALRLEALRLAIAHARETGEKPTDVAKVFIAFLTGAPSDDMITADEVFLNRNTVKNLGGRYAEHLRSDEKIALNQELKNRGGVSDRLVEATIVHTEQHIADLDMIAALSKSNQEKSDQVQNLRSAIEGALRQPDKTLIRAKLNAALVVDEGTEVQ